MRVVYIDRLFLLNLAADYFLLLLTARIGGVYPKRRRLLLGSMVGAMLALLLYFPKLPLLASIPVRCAVCLCVAYAAFGRKKKQELLRLCAIFTLATLLLGGGMLALSLAMKREGMVQNGFLYSEISMPVMLVCFPLAYLLSACALGRGRGDVHRKTRELCLEVDGKSLCLRLLCDSGNLLRDPFSGSRVIVLSGADLIPLFPEAATLLQQGCPIQTLLLTMQERCNRAFWLLPAQTVEKNTMLLLFRPDKLYLDKKQTEGYVVGITTKSMEIGDCRGLIGVEA